MTRCGLCGLEFDETVSTACACCPMNRGCKLIRCPGCGYEMPPEPHVIRWLRRVLKRRKTGETQ